MEVKEGLALVRRAVDLLFIGTCKETEDETVIVRVRGSDCQVWPVH